VSSAVDLPEAWAQWAPLATEPFTVPSADIAEHRDEWVRAWTDLVTS
jgi:thiamine transport system substrate-binding protein